MSKATVHFAFFFTIRCRLVLLEDLWTVEASRVMYLTREYKRDSRDRFRLSVD